MVPPGELTAAPPVTTTSARQIAGRTLVVFADDWGRHPSSCQHLFRRLLAENRVLWVHTIGTRVPTLSWADLRRTWGKLREWTAPRAEATANDRGEGPEVLCPVMIPFERVPGVKSWNARSVGNAVREALGTGTPAILVTTIPNVAPLVGTFGEALSVYYCVDEFSEWPGADRETLVAMERELLGKVDLVLATADTLFESKSNVHSQVRLLRHGVDWDRFHAGSGNAPTALDATVRPVIGFVGLIDERLDVPLVTELASRRPDASFVFLGPRQLGACALDRLPNVRFLPPVPYEDVPAVLHRFDVAVLPYVVNELTERINPLKLRELLASGVPIVATALPEVVRFGASVRTPQGVDGWCDALRAACEEGRSGAATRAEGVRGESWERRAMEFSQFCREAETATTRAEGPSTGERSVNDRSEGRGS